MYQKHDVTPDLLGKWQTTINRVAAAFDVPAALLMRVWPEQIEVLLASVGDDNPYVEHEKADLGTSLYCETVMATRAALFVPDALADPDWCNNPDVRLNMICYLGVPVVWPDGSIFGTVCVLDSRRREFPQPCHELLWRVKDGIENDFRALRAAGPQGVAITPSDIDADIARLLANLKPGAGAAQGAPLQ